MSVPTWEWDQIPHWASMEKRRYIQRKLQIDAPLVFSERDRSYFKEFPRDGRTTRFE